ncbi:MAG: hypothetical protein ABI748_08050 [Dokdonella sp.]
MTRPISDLRLRTGKPIPPWLWRFPSGLDGVVAAGIAVLIALCVYASWPVDLRVPFLMTGDATSAQYIFKALLEHGTYTRNPDIGAPFGATMYDYPIPEPTHFLLIRLLGLFSKDPFLAFNMFYLISFATAAFAACWAFKRNGIERLPAIAGAIAFAILPYHFYRLAHVFLASYFAIPIMGHYALRLATFRAQHLDGARAVGWGALLALAIAAGSGVYYAFFGVLFITLAAVLGALHSRHWALLRTGTVYVAVIVGVIAFSLLPNALYHHAEGANALVAQRSPASAEIFGLRLTQLLFPTPGHRLPWFDQFINAYKQSAPLVNENATAALGLIGSTGFLLALAAFFSGNIRRYPLLSAAGALCTAGVLYATIGGFGAIVARLATPEIRGLNRISVFIAFFALFAFLVIARQLIGRHSRQSTNFAFALAVVALAWLDQIPVHAVGKPNAAAFAKQQASFARLQTVVPQGTALFELPYDYFPESPKPPGSYVLLEPYLFTRGLRWSFGDMHGRPSDVWNEQASRLHGNGLSDALADAGFGAIYVDRRGYTDHGTAITKELTMQFGAPIMEDVAQGYVIYRVPSPTPNTPPFIAVETGRGWFPWEPSNHPNDQGAWSRGNADLVIANPNHTAVLFTVKFKLTTLMPRKVTLSYGKQVLSVAQLAPGKPVEVEVVFDADAGVSRLSLATDVEAQLPGNGDRRRLAFRIEDLAYGPRETRIDSK